MDLFARTGSAPFQRATFDGVGGKEEGVRVQEILGSAFDILELNPVLVVPLLFEVRLAGWQELSLPLVCLLVASLAAALAPAVRAARLEPMEALRQD